jgi:hypothetical protein
MTAAANSFAGSNSLTVNPSSHGRGKLGSTASDHLREAETIHRARKDARKT